VVVKVQKSGIVVWCKTGGAMRILLTGSKGYIGTVMAAVLATGAMT
jgi:hypothetical protein